MRIMRILPVFFNERKGKISGCGADIYFSCAINEQTACEAGNKARKRGFASERVASALRRQ